MLIRIVSLSVVIASTLTGCAENKAQAEKAKFANAIKSVKNADAIAKVDVQLNDIMNRVAAKPSWSIKKGAVDDMQVAKRAVNALLAYVELDRYSDPEIVRVMSDMIGSARKMSLDAALFDSAVDNLDMTLRKRSRDAMVFPNYQAYEFVRAVFHILTDGLFDIDHSKDVQDSLRCASGALGNSCQGSRNPLVVSVLSAIQRIRNIMPPNADIPVNMGKIVFLPVYIFLNHNSIPREFRDWTVKLLNAIVEFIENAPKDPEAAQEYFETAMDLIEFTPEESRMLDNIGRNIQKLIEKIEMKRMMGNFGNLVTGPARIAWTSTVHA